ncbi:MAG: hypothetical protein N2746_06170 [Deltaproteobacteria bacterium]|nr:hypothetical protein [Deltaproteobacteria bacterium]
MGRTFIALILILVMNTFVGCPPKNMQLNESLFHFNNAYRWKRNDLSSDFIYPSHRSLILKDLRSHEKGISISELEIEDIFVDNKKGVALVKIRVSYLMTNETILREEVISQYWLKEQSNWYFVGQSGSERLSIPIPEDLKSRIFWGTDDAGVSDN